MGDQDWGGLAVAFAPNRRSSGITYDPVNDSLWVTNTQGFADRVQQYKTDGTFVSEFTIAIPGGYAIAYDAADDSLWVVESFGSPSIHQFDKNGNNLQNLAINGISNQVLGAEFAQRVPGPGAAGLLGLAGLAAGRRRR
jgi:MYXO-CTERM domain-containing protein